MTSRAERHQEMAEAALRAHQALTQDHVAGREPQPVQYPDLQQPVTMYIPQYGENQFDHNPLMGSETSLRELRMYWKRIPDFGVNEYEIFTSEKGWTQILCWRGTGEDGAEYRGDEVDVVYTDDDFNVTRVEIYSDAKQWSAIVAYANDKTIEEMKDSPGYAELLADASGG